MLDGDLGVLPAEDGVELVYYEHHEDYLQAHRHARAYCCLVCAPPFVCELHTFSEKILRAQVLEEAVHAFVSLTLCSDRLHKERLVLLFTKDQALPF